MHRRGQEKENVENPFQKEVIYNIILINAIQKAAKEALGIKTRLEYNKNDSCLSKQLKTLIDGNEHISSSSP